MIAALIEILRTDDVVEDLLVPAPGNHGAWRTRAEFVSVQGIGHIWILLPNEVSLDGYQRWVNDGRQKAINDTVLILNALRRLALSTGTAHQMELGIGMANYLLWSVGTMPAPRRVRRPPWTRNSPLYFINSLS